MDKTIRDLRAGADTATPEGQIKLALAIELDQMFIASKNSDGMTVYVLHPMYAEEFGDVRDRLYKVFMRMAKS